MRSRRRRGGADRSSRFALVAALVAGSAACTIAAPIYEEVDPVLSPTKGDFRGFYASLGHNTAKLAVRRTFPEGQCTPHTLRDVAFEGFRFHAKHVCKDGYVKVVPGMTSPAPKGCGVKKGVFKSVYLWRPEGVELPESGDKEAKELSNTTQERDTTRERYDDAKDDAEAAAEAKWEDELMDDDDSGADDLDAAPDAHDAVLDELNLHRDPMLNEPEVVPETLTPPAPTEDDDARALQAMLRRLARPRRVALSRTDVLLHPMEAGVGMTIEKMVLPVLRMLATGRTLLAPRLTLWATEEECGEVRDWSCFFDALSSTKHAHGLRVDNSTGELMLRLSRTPRLDGRGEMRRRRRWRMAARTRLKLLQHGRSYSSRGRHPHMHSHWRALQRAVLGDGDPSIVAEELTPLSQPAQLTVQGVHLTERALHEGDEDDVLATDPSSGTVPRPAPSRAQAIWEQVRTTIWDDPMGDRGFMASRPEQLLSPTRIEEHTIQKLRAICTRERIGCPTVLKKWWFVQQDETEILSKLPQRFLKRGRGWLVSQVIRFLVQPNAKLREQLAAEKARLGIGIGGPLERERFVAVHVRKGDACKERAGASCFGLTQLQPQIERFLHLYNISTVYVASPDSSVFAEARERPDITWLHRAPSKSADRANAAYRKIGLEIALYHRWVDDFYIDPAAEVSTHAESSIQAPSALRLPLCHRLPAPPSHASQLILASHDLVHADAPLHGRCVHHGRRHRSRWQLRVHRSPSGSRPRYRGLRLSQAVHNRLRQLVLVAMVHGS